MFLDEYSAAGSASAGDCSPSPPTSPLETTGADITETSGGPLTVNRFCPASLLQMVTALPTPSLLLSQDVQLRGEKLFLMAWLIEWNFIFTMLLYF